MKTYDLYKLATQKVLSSNYCILSIKVAENGKSNEMTRIGVIDKNEDIVYDMQFEPLENGETATPDKKYFKNEFEGIVKVLSEYDYIVLFNEKSTKKLFHQMSEKYGLSTRLVDKLFNKVVCARVLYDAYIGFMNTKLEIACKVEGIDTSDTRDTISICSILHNFIKTIASEYTHPQPEMYASLLTKNNENKPKQVHKKKEATRPKKTDEKHYSDYFKEGKTVAEIASICNVKPETVERHIFNDYEKGLINNIDSLIQPEYTQNILDAISKDSWDGRLRSIKETLPEECTYVTIKGVIAKNKKGLYTNLEANEEVVQNTIDISNTDIETETKTDVSSTNAESLIPEEKVQEDAETKA